ncbi:MAG: hypothetical protein K6G01_07910 [Eubacterium sp.]|nr:hypothetical protein [Eubacterium sp.]
MREKKDANKAKKSNDSIAIVFSIIIAIAAVLFEIYFMLNYSYNLLYIGVFAIIALIAVGIFTSELVKIHHRTIDQMMEHYDQIEKAQKASYLMERKSFGQLDHNFDLIDDKNKKLMHEVMSNERSVGKALLQKMNARVDEMEQKMDALVPADNSDYRAELEMQISSIKTDLQNALKEMELNLRSEIMNHSVAVMPAQAMAAPTPAPVMPAGIETAVQEEPVMEEVPMEAEQEEESLIEVTTEMEPENIVPEEVDDGPVLMEEEVAAEEPMKEEAAVEEPVVEEVAMEEAAAEEPVVEEAAVEEPKIEPVSDDPNKMMSPEDIAALLEGANAAAEEPAAEEPVVEEAAVEEPIVEETKIEPVSDDPNKMMSPEDIAALLEGANAAAEEPAVEEPVVEEAVVEEPIVEEPKIEPVSDDPNKMMSPEEIAALVEGANAEAEEPVAEPEPEPEPAAEEKPPMPDLSDPNKVMTPDEIAALLANM